MRLELGIGDVHKSLVDRVTRAGEVMAKIASSQAIFCTTERGTAPDSGRRKAQMSGDVVELQLLHLINGRRNVHDLLRLDGYVDELSLTIGRKRDGVGE